MIRQIDNTPFSQRQLRVGELIKQSLGQIFLKDEAKVPTLETKNITVTEVRMSPDLKNARAYVIHTLLEDSAAWGINFVKNPCSFMRPSATLRLSLTAAAANGAARKRPEKRAVKRDMAWVLGTDRNSRPHDESLGLL